MHIDTSCLEIEIYVTSNPSLRCDTCRWYLKNLAFFENQSADASKKNDKFYLKRSWSQTNLSIENVAFLKIDCFAETLVLQTKLLILNFSKVWNYQFLDAQNYNQLDLFK